MSGMPARLVAAAVALSCAWPSSARAQEASGPPTFVEVSEILQRRCVVCHSGAAAPLGLELDNLTHLKSGSWNGPVVQAGKPEDSKLIRRIKGISKPRMPFNGPPFLDEREIALIEAWVQAGMPEGDPGKTPPLADAVPMPAPGEPVLFTHVEPIFLQRCMKCHSDANPKGPPEGLRLGTLAQILAGGDRVVVVPGNPGASELVRRIRGRSLPRMPFDGPPFLDDEQIRLITDWIANGAPDGTGKAAPVPVGRRLRLEGTLTARWRLDDTPLMVTEGTRIDRAPEIGDRVEVRGSVGGKGEVEVERLRRR